MKLALMLRPEDKDRWVLARQIGVNHAIVSLSSVLDKITRDEYLDTLRQIKATYEESGLTIAGVESHPVAAEKIKLGVPGRDEEIANYCAVIEALGKVGIPMCCYNFKLMGDDIQSLVREFGKQDKIFFVHLRDVQGTRERFRETFHDNGPTDMAEMLRLYHEVGFLGPIRPYHAPTLADESNQRPGYAMQGKVFAIGYMKGIAEALNISVI
ncbi:MAG: mannonate dehydratase [Phycisphaerae bacterium]|nr:mannonate dehydratase [Phycisphaerae bacterium]